CSIVISVNSSSTSPTTRRARKTRILPVSASIRTWISSSPATRRYADWIPSSTAPISCSREICFSALSCRRAPTKSRLTMASVRCADVRSPLKKKRGGHPRHGAAVQLPLIIHPGAWTAQTRASGGGNSRAGEALRDIVLEDLDDLGHQPVATKRAIEAAVDEDGRHRLLER